MEENINWHLAYHSICLTHSPLGGPVRPNALQVAHLHALLCQELLDWACPLILSKEINNQMQRCEHSGFPIQDVHADQETLGAQFKLSNLLSGNQSHFLCF